MINEFFKPTNSEDALKLKKENKNSFYLGGGTKLNKGGESFGAEVFISLENLGLKGIFKVGDKVKIGASETLQHLIDSSVVPQFLRESVQGETNRNIRNASTIAGVIASGKTWSTVLAGLMALEAEVETADGGVIAVSDYVEKGMSALILSVSVPYGNTAVYQNNQRKTSNSNPEITVAVSISKSGETLSKAVVVLGGVAEVPIRLSDIEKKLLDGSLTNADAVQDSVMDLIVQYTEKKEKGEYLNYLCSVMVADCVGRCMKA
jgi:probable selenate reductase FAD-binding subunit